MYKNNSIEQLQNNSQLDSKDHFVKKNTDQQLEYLLSNFLKYGVLIASTVVLLGGILYLIDHGSETAQYQVFQGTSAELRSPIGVVNNVLSGSSTGIIQLGLLLLVSIPVFRVIICFFTFIWKREPIYVIITSLVLASLSYSLIRVF